MAALQGDRKAVNIGAARAEQLVLREKAACRHQLSQGFPSEVRTVGVLSPTLACRGFGKLSPSSVPLLETCANVGKLVQLVKFHVANPSPLAV